MLFQSTISNQHQEVLVVRADLLLVGCGRGKEELEVQSCLNVGGDLDMVRAFFFWNFGRSKVKVPLEPRMWCLCPEVKTC